MVTFPATRVGVVSVKAITTVTVEGLGVMTGPAPFVAAGRSRHLPKLRLSDFSPSTWPTNGRSTPALVA